MRNPHLAANPQQLPIGVSAFPEIVPKSVRGSHLDEKSAFRPCGRDLVEFFNSTGWAFYGQMKSVRKHCRLPRNITRSVGG